MCTLSRTYVRTFALSPFAAFARTGARLDELGSSTNSADSLALAAALRFMPARKRANSAVESEESRARSSFLAWHGFPFSLSARGERRVHIARGWMEIRRGFNCAIKVKCQVLLFRSGF